MPKINKPSKVEVVVTDELLKIIEKSPYKDRIMVASSYLVGEALEASMTVRFYDYKDRPMDEDEDEDDFSTYREDDDYTDFSKEKVFRNNTFRKEHPEHEGNDLISYPVELMSDDLITWFAFSSDGKDNLRVIQAIIAEGESLGLWKHYPAGTNKGYSLRKLNPDGSQNEHYNPSDMKWHVPNRLCLTGTWWTGEPKAMKVVVRKPIANFKDAAKVELAAQIKEANDVMVNMHHKFMSKIALPTFSTLFNKAKTLASLQMTTKSSKRIYKLNHSDRQLCLYTIAAKFLNKDIKSIIAKRLKYTDAITGASFESRCYTTFTMLKKWLRSELTVEGERLVAIDAQCLHPNIVGKLVREANIPCEFLKGDVHQSIADMLSIDRETAKAINVSYWNHGKKSFIRAKNGKLLQKFHEHMIQNHKDVLDFMDAESKKYKFIDKQGFVIKSHRATSRILFYWESIIIANLMKKLDAAGIACNQTYDCIYVKASNAPIAIDLFNKTLAEFNIQTKATISRESYPCASGVIIETNGTYAIKAN